jgi:uncharacterized protein
MDLIRRHALLLGIAAMFALTWPLYARLGLFVGWGVSLAALIVTAIAHGRAGLASLLRRFLIWRVPFPWYLLILLGPALLFLLALALFVLTTGSRPDPRLSEVHGIFGPGANPLLLAVPFLIFDALTNGEEIGWRGFVLPRLQTRLTALASSLILGAIWGLWHLPKFWAEPTFAAIGFALAHAVIVAILYTWVFNSTGGSLLLVTLLHASFNTAYVMLPVNPAAAGSPLIQLFVLAVEAVAALVVIARTGPVHLASRGRTRQAAPARTRT